MSLDEMLERERLSTERYPDLFAQLMDGIDPDDPDYWATKHYAQAEIALIDQLADLDRQNLHQNEKLLELLKSTRRDALEARLSASIALTRITVVMNEARHTKNLMLGGLFGLAVGIWLSNYFS